MADLLQKDKSFVWHPFTPLLPESIPLLIERAQGVYLYTPEGRKILDAISSWWVNLHGHGHPHLARVLTEQAQILEHIIFAGFTHKPAIDLAERLLSILPSNQSKIFYSDNGSTACEVALKMAMQYWHNKQIKKTKIIALEGAYHGDTFGAMSVGDRSPFNAPFTPYLFEVEFIALPTCHQPACCQGTRDDTTCLQVKQVIEQFTKIAESGEVAAFIYEPVVQGASGMRMYSPEILNQLLAIAHKHEIICIADEVMTGFGRTGRLFASEYCEQLPDIVCLSKGLTGGFMPMGVTSCTEKIIEAYQSEDILKTFFHGHSFTANPLACRVALASLDVLLQSTTMSHIHRIAQQHLHFENKIKSHPKVKEARSIGVILAIELNTDQQTGYFNEARHNLYTYFLEKDILLRPLGNVIYVLPPYVITNSELAQIYEVIEGLLNNEA